MWPRSIQGSGLIRGAGARSSFALATRVVSCRRGSADHRACAESARLSARVENVLCVHRARVERRCFVGGQRAAQTFVAALDLN